MPLIKRVKEYWKKKGGVATVRAIARTLLGVVVRHRCRLVFEAPITPRAPSVWGPSERLLIFGPENIHEMTPELRRTMDAERHSADLESIRDGNRLFVVAYGD